MTANTINLADYYEVDEAAEAQAAPYTLLFSTAMCDTGGGIACLNILLSMYNGERFKADLNDLRRLDFGRHAAAIAAMQDEVSCANYVHERIAREIGYSADDVQDKLEWLAYTRGIPGRCKKTQLPANPGRFDFNV